MLVSSAYDWPYSPWSCIIVSTSAVYSRNDSGPSTLPCGTSQTTAKVVDWSSPTWTARVLPVTNDSAQDRTVPLMPNDLCRRSSKMSWSTVSNTADIVVCCFKPNSEHVLHVTEWMWMCLGECRRCSTLTYRGTISTVHLIGLHSSSLSHSWRRTAWTENVRLLTVVGSWHVVLCKYSKFRIESNSYFWRNFTLVFDSIRNEHNYLKFSNTYRHQFLTYLTEWRRFFTLATTPSNQQNQQTWSRQCRLKTLNVV